LPAGDAVVLAVVAELYHSSLPPEPAMLAVGSRVVSRTGLSTINSADLKRRGVVGMFVGLSIAGSDVVAMI